MSFDPLFDEGFAQLRELPAVYSEPKPKAVVIGGGTGAPVSIRALLSLGFNVSSIVAMADDGGSTGILRRLPGISAPGDVRKCLVAMADDRDEAIAIREEVFRMRLMAPGHHVVGNLILGGDERSLGSFGEAIAACERLLKARGHVIPSTFDPITLGGVDSRGKVLYGQWDICHSQEPISRVFLAGKTQPTPNAEALAAIAEADLVVLGPGSLFTSIVPNLLIPGIPDALIETKAHVAFVCPLADAQGETRGMDVLGYVRALERHGLKGRINAIIVNKPQYGEGVRTYLAHDRLLDCNVYSVAYTEDALQGLVERGMEPYLRPLADNRHLTWHNPILLRNVFLEVAETCRSTRM